MNSLIEHQSSVDNGLKMKIKRKTSGEKHSSTATVSLSDKKDLTNSSGTVVSPATATGAVDRKDQCKGQNKSNVAAPVTSAATSPPATPATDDVNVDLKPTRDSDAIAAVCVKVKTTLTKAKGKGRKKGSSAPGSGSKEEKNSVESEDTDKMSDCESSQPCRNESNTATKPSKCASVGSVSCSVGSGAGEAELEMTTSRVIIGEEYAPRNGDNSRRPSCVATAAVAVLPSSHIKSTTSRRESNLPTSTESISVTSDASTTTQSSKTDKKDPAVMSSNSESITSDLSSGPSDDDVMPPPPSRRDFGTEPCHVGVMTDPDSLGPCEPGTSVVLEGIVWSESNNGLLVVNVTWRGKTYVGTLMDSTKHHWAPPRFIDDSPQNDASKAGCHWRDGRATVGATSEIIEGRRLRKCRKDIAASSAVTTSRSSTSARQTPVVVMSQLDLDRRPSCLSSDRDDDSQKKPTPSSSSNGEELIECSEPNCNKKYRHANGLRYHQNHAHKKHSGRTQTDTKSSAVNDKNKPSSSTAKNAVNDGDVNDDGSNVVNGVVTLSHKAIAAGSKRKCVDVLPAKKTKSDLDTISCNSEDSANHSAVSVTKVEENGVKKNYDGSDNRSHENSGDSELKRFSPGAVSQPSGSISNCGLGGNDVNNTLRPIKAEASESSPINKVSTLPAPSTLNNLTVHPVGVESGISSSSSSMNDESRKLNSDRLRNDDTPPRLLPVKPVIDRESLLQIKPSTEMKPDVRRVSDETGRKLDRVHESLQKKSKPDSEERSFALQKEQSLSSRPNMAENDRRALALDISAEQASRDYYMMEQMRQMYMASAGGMAPMGQGAQMTPYGYAMDPTYHLHLMATNTEYRMQYERWMLDQKRLYQDLIQQGGGGLIPRGEDLKPVDMSSKKSVSDTSSRGSPIPRNTGSSSRKNDGENEGDSKGSSKSRKSYPSGGSAGDQSRPLSSHGSYDDSGRNQSNKDRSSFSSQKDPFRRQETPPNFSGNYTGQRPPTTPQFPGDRHPATTPGSSASKNYPNQNFPRPPSVPKSDDQLKQNYMRHGGSSPSPLTLQGGMPGSSSSSLQLNSKLLPAAGLLYPSPADLQRSICHSNPLVLDKELGGNYANEMMLFESRTALDLLQQRAASLHNKGAGGGGGVGGGAGSGGGGRSSSRSPLTVSSSHLQRGKEGGGGGYSSSSLQGKDAVQLGSIRDGGGGLLGQPSQPVPSSSLSTSSRDSPPAKRHLHTHHHTHVINAPYPPHPMYGQYAASILSAAAPSLVPGVVIPDVYSPK